MIGCLRSKLCALLSTLLILALALSPAFAHASLVSARPAPGAVVAPMLKEIRLTFDETLSPASMFVMFTQDFQTVPGIAPLVEGNVIRAMLLAPLSPRTYIVQWTAVSADGDTVQGSYQFGVSNSIWAWIQGWFSAEFAVGAFGLVIIGTLWFVQRRSRQRRTRQAKRP